LAQRFSLDGNRDPDALWTTRTVQHVDGSGNLQLLATPLTPAEFALGEVRFAKQFRALRADEQDAAVPVADYVELPPEGRAGKVPFVHATDDDRRLTKVACGRGVVNLVEDRRRHWQALQFLSGRTVDALAASHRAELADLQARYDEATAARETSMDEIAAAMAELATSSSAPTVPTVLGMPGAALPAAAPAAAAEPTDRPIWLDPADESLCNDCGTCYQELPQLFEKATIVVDGQAQLIGRLKPGALDGLELTPALVTRVARVKATCDAEIIR
jgi:pyruvate-ferredoxin/flavodoxin oxidoreductase